MAILGAALRWMILPNNSPLDRLQDAGIGYLALASYLSIDDIVLCNPPATKIRTWLENLLNWATTSSGLFFKYSSASAL